MRNMYINEASKTLDTLSYRDERAMKFKVFNSKFKNAVNILDSVGRIMHNKDVIELLWTKLNTAELTVFVTSIKVDYRHNRQNTLIFCKRLPPRFQPENTTVHNGWGVRTQDRSKQ